jgi:hypothetical protein
LSVYNMVGIILTALQAASHSHQYIPIW